ncbi:Uncharacterized alpha/beta hydrolase domain [Thalassovita litoralis]|jgi:uncharacterized protein (DUF2235 family)|uniref:Uncharacterized alpha/beta hydrolase domain n=1 Tax=Thalassovita litoralis TaxID=1010611 RepID=A0A521F9K4_9RHOB|nr:DUF2235 domain-containing protein [Thalassovita litoralis]SMO92806.1 Uncharacterized alpha/beta hydrolase domain [Thalassovita litoralis]
MFRRLGKRLFGWAWPGQREGHSAPQPTGRGALCHVIILDGTMSSLQAGEETNAGLTYRLLSEIGAPVSVYYEAGIQWQDWRNTADVLMGRGINRQIRRAYGYLASRYRPGDRIFLMGYSRGAYAVRSLAGVIDNVGLLRPEHATERQITLAYRHYQTMQGSPAAQVFSARYCHERVDIEMVGVWDTVKSLGLRLPVLWQWSEPHHSFHNHALGAAVKHGYHALALDETREVFTPILWECGSDFTGTLEQVWFAGAHGDVGGQVGDYPAARGLSNIPLVWMLDRAENCGLPLPTGWRGRFPCDPNAPAMGTWRGWGKMFLLRQRRTVGADPSERVHETAAARSQTGLPLWHPV